MQISSDVGVSPATLGVTPFSRAVGGGTAGPSTQSFVCCRSSIASADPTIVEPPSETERREIAYARSPIVEPPVATVGFGDGTAGSSTPTSESSSES